MALTIGELVGFLRVDDSGWNQKLDKAQAGFQRVGTKVSDAGKQLTTKVTLPLVGAGFAILNAAGNFEASMNQVRAATGATGEDLAKMEGLAKELGSTTQFSASQAADAMYFLASAGFDTAEIMSTLPGVLDLAAAGNMDLAAAADIASNILSGYGMEADQLARVNDALVKTFQSSNVNVQMVGDSMKMVAPVAAAAGLQFEEVTAAIGLLGNAGIQGSEAGTALRGAIARLIKPTGEVKETLSDLGVEVLDNQGNLRSLAGIMGDLEGAGASTADMITIFGQEAGPAMQALLSQGAGALEGLTGELENAGGTAEHVADVQMEGLKGGIAGLKSALEGLMLAIADTGLLEWATEATTKFTGWLQSLSKTNPKLLKLAVIIGAVLATLGPVLFVVGKIITVFGTAIKVAGKLARALFLLGRATATTIIWLGRMGLVALRAAGQVALAAGRIMLAAGRMAATMAATAARVVAAWVLMAVQSLLQAARMALAWIIAMGPIGLIIAAVVALVALIVANWDTVREWTVKIWTAIWNGIKAAWDFIVGLVKKGLRFVGNLVKNWTLPGLIFKHWDRIKGAFRAGFKFVRGLVGNALRWVRDRWNNALAFVRKVPGRIRSALSRLKSMLMAPFKAAFNAVAGLWNRSIGRVSFSVPSWVPGVGGRSFGFPSMPHLARGGDIRRAGLAVVGERGPELLHLPTGASVEPLDRRPGRAEVHGTILLKGDGILRGLREYVQISGGQVQAVLG